MAYVLRVLTKSHFSVSRKIVNRTCLHIVRMYEQIHRDDVCNVISLIYCEQHVLQNSSKRNLSIRVGKEVEVLIINTSYHLTMMIIAHYCTRGCLCRQLCASKLDSNFKNRRLICVFSSLVIKTLPFFHEGLSNTNQPQ